jgi:hypothetical protein
MDDPLHRICFNFDPWSSLRSRTTFLVFRLEMNGLGARFWSHLISHFSALARLGFTESIY